VLLTVAFFCEQDYSNRNYNERDVRNFQKILHTKEIYARGILRETQNILEEEGESILFTKLADKYADLYSREGTAFFIYQRDELIFWTSNSISPPSDPTVTDSSEVIKLQNSWFLKEVLLWEDYSFISLILIRSDYPYENRVLDVGFQGDFNLSENVNLLVPGNEDNNPVYNRNSQLICSLDFTLAKKENKLKASVCLILYFLCLFLFLTLLRNILHKSKPENKNLSFLIITLIIISFYYIAQYFRFPDIIFDLELFSPLKFAHSSYLPSLGNLFIIAVLGFFIIYNFYLEVLFNKTQLKKYKLFRYSIFLITGIISMFLFYANTFIFRSLILDSSISFETYKVLEISIYTFIGFLILGLIFSSWTLLLDKIFGILMRLNLKNEALAVLISVNIIAFLIFLLTGGRMYPESYVFFLIVSIALYYFKIIKPTLYRISTFLIFILLFSLYSAIQIFRYTEIKATSDMKIMAVNLSSEHDPVAELLFVDISKKIQNDSELRSLLFEPFIDFKAIYTDIHRNYFSGYWDKYDLQITLCRPDDNVYISPPEDQWAHCYDFFYETIMLNAVEVPNSNFFFLNNLNGRISYFTAITFYQGKKEITVFIELDSRLLSEGLGYPELLLDEDMQKDSRTKYSYAKYNQGKLITSSGQYAYRMTSELYSKGTEAFELIKLEGYDHVTYNIDKDNFIIVTRPSVFFIDIIISFSYIFIFYFSLLIVILILTKLSPSLSDIRWDFKNKIQVAMSSVIIFTVLLIGAGTVYLSIRQYRNRQVDNLKEKVQSVYIELIHKLEYEQDLHAWSSESYFNLEQLLQKFSNVFYTDINLYDTNGWLLASSRPEIFEAGLNGKNMNAQAYVGMIRNQRSEFIHNESIGKLKYLSAYVPFVNTENKILAYLNLPFFTRQDELTMEIANLVVGIINILVFLTLLSIALAVLISNTITQPLQLIQQHISRFNLNQNNEKISYKGKDEIGSLINEYNQMIDQLRDSAEKLARSERETAWREMAKQIAHEIKNPLTPMRLILQHLQRAWKEDPETREQQLEKLSKILIEQIDNLSKIASEFSNFAKMPLPKNEKVNLSPVINNVAKLFGKTDNITITVKNKSRDRLFVWADKEHISRAFINLVKNAIQSVPEGKQGNIEIVLEKTDQNMAIIKVKDNGKGIPEDIRDRLFQPNFTTKSSGMGMGLAITKNIITTSGGNISYETELNKGSLFIVELPCLNE